MKITSHLVTGAVAACCLLTVGACDDAKKDAAKADAGAAKSDADAKKPAQDAAADAKAAEEAKAEEPKGEEPAADAKVEALPEIGVPECDNYVQLMTACFDKDVVPENLRDAQREGFAVTVRGWADAVKTNPASKDGVAVGCKAAADMAKRSFPKCFE